MLLLIWHRLALRPIDTLKCGFDVVFLDLHQSLQLPPPLEHSRTDIQVAAGF